MYATIPCSFNNNAVVLVVEMGLLYPRVSSNSVAEEGLDFLSSCLHRVSAGLSVTMPVLCSAMKQTRISQMQGK